MPQVPKRQDMPSDTQGSDDEFDDDGGIKPKSYKTISTIIPHEAPRLLPFQKSSSPPVPPRWDLDEDDDDGGINPAVIAKKKKEAEEKKKKKKKQQQQQKPVVVPHLLDDDDEDGGVRPQKAKPKAKPKAKEKAPARSDDDDDGVPMREPAKKKPPKPKKAVKKVVDDDMDDDGGLPVKSYNTIRTIMPSKAPQLGPGTKKEPSPKAADDGSMLTPTRSPPTPSSPVSRSFDTVGQIVPKLSTNATSVSRKTPRVENHYDTIPTDEERAARASYATYAPPPYDQTSNAADLQLLRTISYREAQHNTPPLMQRRPTLSSSIRSQSNTTTNEDSSHYSEITPHAGVINRSYSHTGSIQSSSSQSLKQQSLQKSEATLKENKEEEEEDEVTEDTSVGTEEEDEEEEEEEEEEVAEAKPVLKKRVPLRDISTAFGTLGHLFDPNLAEEIAQIRRQKQARFRWFLAYTILNNYHLFDLRKQAQSRLALLRIQRSNLMDDQQYVTAGNGAVLVQLPVESPQVPQPKMARSPQAATEPRSPPVTRQLLSVPMSVMDNSPQSPAERYIAIRSCMLYDALGQPIGAPRSPEVSQAPSVITQTKMTPTTGSLGFQTPGKRPAFERQASESSSPMVVMNLQGTPVFHGVPESNQSTADYPLGNGSTITSSSTLRTQMSHSQHMQAWRQTRLRKIQKKCPHRYVYGAPPQRSMEEKLSTAAILTPQVIVTSPQPQVLDTSQRQASSSPFRFPRQAKRGDVQKLNEKAARKATAEEKRAPRTTTALIHQKQSPGSLAGVTEV